MKKFLGKLIKQIKIVLLLGLLSIGFILLTIHKTTPSEAATFQTITDQNADGRINLIDARILSPPATTNCPVCVDVNGDKKIDQTDVDLVQGYVDLLAKTTAQARAPQPNYKSRFDVNADMTIDTNDVAIIKNYLGQTVESPVFGLDDPTELTNGFLANDILIKFKPQTTEAEKQALFAKYKLDHKRNFQSINTDNLKASEVNVENLQKQIKAEPIVKSTKKNYLFEFSTDDPYWNDQWGHRKIRIEETWNRETRGRTPNKVKVAIIDTGADYSHEDLTANLSQTLRRNVEVDSGLRFEQQDVTDEAGHGTAMAGIIGATANNNKAIAGLNWDVEIIPIKAAVQNSLTGEWEIPLPYMYLAFEWAAIHHADIDVLSMSFGVPGITSDENVDYYLDALDSYGVILIAAAGNLGRDDSEYPANYPKVTSVGATLANDALCPNSSGRTSADILAPGDYIFSTVPVNVDWDSNPDGVAYLGCGTSQATAYVSGVAALCRAVAPVSPIRSDLKCNKFRHSGYGRIDAWATLWYINCKRFNNDNTGRVSVLDSYAVSWRVNTPAAYNSKYDVWPVGGDGIIDDHDVYVQLSRQGAVCQ